MQVKQRLDALTSLRFFAAAMIVIYHSADLFGRGSNSNNYFLLGQAVSFFFVLSGFILAYVYPKLETWPEIKQFYRARIARIWPAQLASFLLACYLLSLSWDSKTALANIFMIHAWIPFQTYFFSYNSVSWSISTEIFFYLVFPFLIHQWDKTWLVKLLASGIIVILLIQVSDLLQLPNCCNPMKGITKEALLYIHPASRIFEFIFGMFIAAYLRKKIGCVQWAEFRASLYEIVAILLAGASMHFVSPLAIWVHTTRTSSGLSALSVWLVNSGSMFAFGFLIYIIAMGRGRVSAWLSHPLLVLLGEISFSVYLLHQILLNYYRANITFFPHLPNIFSLTIFWVILLLSSYLMWALIEMPSRRLILGRGQKKIHGTNVMQESWRSHLNLNRNTISASIVLTCLLTTIYYTMMIGSINSISPSDADIMTPKELKSVVGTRFGNLFALRGIKVEHKDDGLYIDLAWESLVEQKLTYSNSIHLTDANGNMLAQADYSQPMSRAKQKPGTIWKDSIFISKDKLKGGECKLAIALYRPNHLLPVDRGDRDWGNQRLLINLERSL